MKIYPLKLKPVTKQILWGGTYLCENFGIGEKGQSIAEAWVMTDRPDGCNTIDNGDYRGMTLDEYINQASKAAVIGKDTDFPLLIKLIDANDRLSVQVHPDDEYAAANGLDAGKTEMWYIVDAKPGAKLVYGLKDKKVPSLDELESRSAERFSRRNPELRRSSQGRLFLHSGRHGSCNRFRNSNCGNTAKFQHHLPSVRL